MGNDEVRISRKCEQCGAELKESDKKCPKCGSNPMYAVQAGGTLSMQGSLNREHVAPPATRDWAILGLIVAIIIPVGLEVCKQFPLPRWAQILIPVIAGLAVIAIVIWRNARFHRLSRWVDRKFTARKRWHDK